MTQYSSNRYQSDNSDGDIGQETKDGRMPPREREDKVLKFIEEHEIALPPKAIYRGLKVQEDITFSYRTVQNILSRMNERGLVMRCDKDELDDGRIVKLPDDASGRRTYYFITKDGRTRLEEPETEASP